MPRVPKHKINVTRSQFAESFLPLNGQPFSLQDYPHMREIYDSDANAKVMKFSRQTGKSTTLANLMIINSALTRHYKTLYVSPTVDQTKVFSHDRVTPVIENSDLIRKHYTSASLVNNVFMKQFLNGSRMYLRYALLNADKLRGYSADENIFDETQDLRPDIIPVVHESMNRSMYKRTLYAGTPKRMKGTLADLWFRSTMNEYVIKCLHCNHWNILGEDNIGPNGTICAKCGRDLSTQHGQWVSTYSETQEPNMQGFRICVLHFANAPWVNWQIDVIEKRKSQSRALFHNESLALEYDDGVAPITEAELRAHCDEERVMSPEPSTELDRSYKSIAGVDYGPINSEISNTVMVVIQKQASKYVVTFAKKFIGKEADYSFIHKEIPRYMNVWKSTFLAADHGMGEASNSEIRSKIGFNRVIAFQHHSSQKEFSNWNPKLNAYTLNRTQSMDMLFDMIKKGRIVFPRWEDFRPFAQDILNIQMEFNEVTNSRSYSNDAGPDDFFHALLYAIVSYEKLSQNTIL